MARIKQAQTIAELTNAAANPTGYPEGLAFKTRLHVRRQSMILSPNESNLSLRPALVTQAANAALAESD